MTYAKVPAFRGTSLLAALFVLAVSGCASASFNVSSQDASADTPSVTNSETGVTDGGVDSSDSEPQVCEPYSCKPGCDVCDAGTQCGNGGVAVCGSTNCSWAYQVDAEAFDCPSGMNMIYQCLHYAGKNTQDFLPRCLFRKGTTADGDTTQWCCPQ